MTDDIIVDPKPQTSTLMYWMFAGSCSRSYDIVDEISTRLWMLLLMNVEAMIVA